MKGDIEKELKKLCGEEMKLSDEGRKDEGVNEKEKVENVDIEKDWGEGKVRDEVNENMVMEDERIRIMNVEKKKDKLDESF